MIEVQNLIEHARYHTGLIDFGPDAFLVPLNRLVADINQSTTFRREMLDFVENDIERILINRLWMFEDLRRNPAIFEQSLTPPLCIVSLPRTGTTKLHRLLSEIDRFRSLFYWQVFMPARVPGVADGGMGQRLAAAVKSVELRMSDADFKKSHVISAKEPEEEAFLLEHSFDASSTGLLHQGENYAIWREASDHSFSYDELLLMLKYLQWQFYQSDPLPFILKAPTNFGREDQLSRILPQSRFVSTHRDPKQVVASVCHLTEAARRRFHRVDDRVSSARYVLRWYSAQAKRRMEWLSANPGWPMLDLSFNQITNDSIGTIASVCDFLGQPLSSVEETRINAWDLKNPRYQHGKPDYDLGYYGLTEKMIDDAFSEYNERYSEYF